MRTEWLKRAGAFLFWTLVSLLLLAGIDQLLVRVPVTLPAPLAVATFYRDLRSRVIELVKGMASAPAKPAKSAPPASIEGVIEQQQSRPVTHPPKQPAPTRLHPSPRAKDRAPRYIYADDGGELHFAETLAEIPEQFRDRARVLGE